MNTKRLFDAVTHQLENFPKNDMLAAKENGKWKTYSTKQVADTVNQLSAGLVSLGVKANDFTPESSDKIAIISNNRPEWVFTDLAVQQVGGILVPVYPTTNPNELAFILNDAAVKFIFVSSEDLLLKVQSIIDKVPSIQGIYTFDTIAGAKHWTEVTALATDALLEEVEAIKQSVPAEQLATIIYTSGTTGTPKGVMLSHSNIYTNVQFSKKSFPFNDAPESKVLSFLPLNHIFEKTCTYIYLYSGISIYYAESLETIGDNLKEIKPNGFTTVPRLLEKVFEKIMAKGSELTGTKRKLFFWAVDLAEKYDNRVSGGAWYNLQLAIANKLIFSKWREALGGNISFIITGGAACQVKLLRIFNAAGVPVYEGYGPTENSPVVCVNRQEKGGTKFGTVGPPIEGIQVKLAEDGEIMVTGPCVMKGYYKRPDLTAETMKDEWLLTGDIGVWDEGKFLKITDRKKELFKTSGGKYVAPQPIENKLKESPFVEQVMVVGSERKFVGALIVPSFATLKEWMREKGIPYTTNEDVIHHPKVLELYRELVESFNKFFNHVEQIKKFELLPREWTVDTGEMTPKLSLKRKVVNEKFKDAIERIYA
ncbi:MAG: long-chain fatty acid--CoA ligase [Sphingobacteriia bacterium 24-36-13]|jgi:long-chain acyl-CoA synthetase|uniref:AMP-dependent synthetase/ligase n=1 Tax=Sediminibacterium sp. TaxID=1917865 RepID=UPI000BCB2B2C|nr:long-chain fatty acid--CoA ligase [Sediminibacterium sp.]OYY11357.1 MAG: long-chain fatty acid--CoA ligase [Sphingobacteriia bacterium 35-36-14]OYZ54299.1 MAG: long-chain fatty acid--CoA ligase [Sphingobacteriia bacterium 24-36-13]OZA64858.1 MAG: long-chain fatty acid--CoA ligase [Sphingobacteriia bacterium 39-36-14]HQS24387.1 long-chain fatty acid--CoA ligase [Sediminibacterium sp.]HQS35417.1 long-chain fatty acid--CoA ligase [Sediminibacterium sp.]